MAPHLIRAQSAHWGVNALNNVADDIRVKQKYEMCIVAVVVSCC